MQTPEEVGESYDLIATRFISSLGEFPDISAAFYNNNFRKTLNQAQKDKHSWVLQGINFKPGQRILDIGCGWGPMLKEISDKGGYALGLTVSENQTKYCKQHGLEALLLDWKDANPERLGKFDGIVSIGAFEHFCSIDEYTQRKQEQIYANFFKFCHDCLQDDGKFYLQTMSWGNFWLNGEPNYPQDFNQSAQKDSDPKILATLIGLSSWWPPVSLDQITKTANPYFTAREGNSGREDYIKTFKEWKIAWERSSINNTIEDIKAIARAVVSKRYRRKLRLFNEMVNRQYFREAFVSHLLDHWRIFFEKKTSFTN